MGMHEWEWAIDAPVTVAFTAGVDHTDLGANYDSVVAAARDNMPGKFELVTMEELNALRSDMLSVPLASFCGAVSREADGMLRLNLYPVPTENESEGCHLLLRRAWTEVAADHKIIQIPPFMELLYTLVLRAVATGLELQGPTRPSLDRQLMEIKQGIVFQSAVETDARMQMNLGRQSGGSGYYGSSTSSWLDRFPLNDP